MYQIPCVRCLGKFLESKCENPPEDSLLSLQTGHNTILFFCNIYDDVKCCVFYVYMNVDGVQK